MQRKVAYVADLDGASRSDLTLNAQVPLLHIRLPDVWVHAVEPVAGQGQVGRWNSLRINGRRELVLGQWISEGLGSSHEAANAVGVPGVATPCWKKNWPLLDAKAQKFCAPSW